MMTFEKFKSKLQETPENVATTTDNQTLARFKRESEGMLVSSYAEATKLYDDTEGPKDLQMLSLDLNLMCPACSDDYLQVSEIKRETHDLVCPACGMIYCLSLDAEQGSALSIFFSTVSKTIAR